MPPSESARRSARRVGNTISEEGPVGALSPQARDVPAVVVGGPKAASLVVASSDDDDDGFEDDPPLVMKKKVNTAPPTPPSAAVTTTPPPPRSGNTTPQVGAAVYTRKKNKCVLKAPRVCALRGPRWHRHPGTP